MEWGIIAKIIGALGVVLVSYGLLIRKEHRQDYFELAGGLCLLTYSLYIRDALFVILQLIFILTVVYELGKLRYKHKK